jgi:hypothetical protein
LASIRSSYIITLYRDRTAGKAPEKTLYPSLSKRELKRNKKLAKRDKAKKEGKKVEKRGCQTGGHVVLYLSAKR